MYGKEVVFVCTTQYVGFGVCWR